MRARHVVIAVVVAVQIVFLAITSSIAKNAPTRDCTGSEDESMNSLCQLGVGAFAGARVFGVIAVWVLVDFVLVGVWILWMVMRRRPQNAASSLPTVAPPPPPQ